MTSENQNSTGEEDRRATARSLVDKAEEARAAGADDHDAAPRVLRAHKELIV